jgi:hypothetical protein
MTDARGRVLPPLAAFLGAFALYWLTSARSPGWVDATILLDQVRRLDVGTWVNQHNLYLLLGHGWLAATPWLDPHRSLVLLSTLLGSVTVALVYLLAEEATGSRAAAALTSAALCLSQSLWWHSTTIEVYTLNTVLIASILLLVFSFLRRGGRWRLFAASFAFGLGISNHVLMGLYAAAFLLLAVLLLARRRVRWWEAAACLGFALAGASLYLAMFANAILSVARLHREAGDGPVASLGRALVAILDDTTGGGFRGFMFPEGLAASRRLFWRVNYVALIAWNFPSAALVFAALGLSRLGSMRAGRTGAAFFLAGILAQAAWSANYLIWDMYAFSLPVYLMLSVPIALGIDAFLRRGAALPRPVRRRRAAVFLTLLVPLALYPSFAHWPARERTVDRYIALYPESERLCGFWDPADYVFNPIRAGYDAVDRFAVAWAARLPPGAHYWDDESKAAYPLQFYYQNVRGVRPDVTVHTIFGLLLTEYGAVRHAYDIVTHLDRGAPVFVAALVEPEREVLNQLFLIESPGSSPGEVRALSAADLVRRFPRTRFEEFPLTADRSLVIWRLTR